MGKHLLLLVGLAAATLPIGRAQILVSIAVPPDNNAMLLVTGATVTFPLTAVSAVVQATMTFTNGGTVDASVIGIAIGGQNYADFSLVNAPLFPLTLTKGQTQAIGLRFSPHRSTDSQATMTISFSSDNLVVTLNGGVANPQYVLTYTDPATNNVYPLTTGTKVAFDPTLVGATRDMTFTARNTGIAPGTLDSISVTGTDVLPINKPLLPATIEPNGAVNFGVRFHPTASTPTQTSGTLVVILGGNSYNIELDASVNIPTPPPAATFVYQISTKSGPVKIPSGGAIQMPDTAVGVQTQLTVTVANAGTGPGDINSITVQGTTFALEALPPLPVTIPAGQTQQFTIDFAPRTPDQFTGSLRIGNDSFALSGTGLGSRLQLTYLQNGTTVPVAENGTIVFSAAAVGSTGQLSVTVLNTGTISALISGVIPTSQTNSYSVPQLALPVTLGPQQSVNFQLVFTPNAVGQISGSLAVENSAWNLSGVGTPPPDLPAFQISTDNGTIQPLSQPMVSLALSSSYPMPLRGTLTLTMALAPYGVDSATQWISGGQTVAFSIPVGATSAIFTGGVTAIGLQVGTLAGTLAVTPSFSLNSGYSLTPSSPGILSLNVPATPPQLLSVQLQLPTSNSFAINVVGYSPTRQLNKLVFQFTPVAGAQLAVNRVEVSVSSAALVYYHNPASQAFGGLFSVTVPITLSTDQATTASLLAKIQSIAVLASSDQGDSPPVMIVPSTP